MELRTSWLEAHAEWGPGVHEDGFGLEPSDEIESAAGFARWVRRLQADPDCTYRWIIEDGRVVGGIALRHPGHAFVPFGGHVGYGIRPSARGQGLAAWALGRMLVDARRLGIDRVVAVCEAGNVASAKTIERLGGERQWPDSEREWRYVIPSASADGAAAPQACNM